MKIMVYNFGVWKPSSDSYIVPSRKSPAGRIKDVCNGIIIEGTGEIINSSELDEHGRYEPKFVCNDLAV